MKSGRAVPGWTGGLILIGILAAPGSRGLLESNMATHMLVQLPLLALSGVLLVSAGGARVRRTVEPYNQYGLSGMLVVLFASSYWMLPRALDAVLGSPVFELVK